MSTDETLYWHFRAEQGEGSAMDWAIGPGEAGGVRIRYGPTGQTVRRIEIPRNGIRGNTGDEIHRRARQQMEKGYVELGLARVSKGRLVPAEPTQEPKRTLCWKTTQPVVRPRLVSALEPMVQRLGTAIPATTVLWHPDQGIEVRHWGQVWRLGFQFGGGFEPSGRGGGRLFAVHGPVPVLVMMALARALPNIFRFTDQEDAEVALRIAPEVLYLQSKLLDFESVRDLGARLDLCLGRIRLDGETEDGENPPLWF